MSGESKSRSADRKSRDLGWSSIELAAGDHSSGAESITGIAARGLASIARSNGDLKAAIKRLLGGHPGMAPLWRLAEDCLSSVEPERAARRWIVRLRREYLKVAGRAAKILPSGLIVTCSYSRTVTATLVLAQSKGTEVLCALSEPGEEGHRTAAELAGNGVSATVVEDKDALRQLGRASAFLCGADAVMPHGLRNKLGTKDLADRARQQSVPSYAVAGESKFIASDLPSERLLEDVPIETFSRIVSDVGDFHPKEASAHSRSRAVKSVEQLLAS